MPGPSLVARVDSVDAMDRRPSLDPAVAEIRRAVRGALAEVSGPVLVGLSGGADSLALASAVAFEAPKLFVVTETKAPVLSGQRA